MVHVLNQNPFAALDAEDSMVLNSLPVVSMQKKPVTEKQKAQPKAPNKEHGYEKQEASKTKKELKNNDIKQEQKDSGKSVQNNASRESAQTRTARNDTDRDLNRSTADKPRGRGARSSFRKKGGQERGRGGGRQFDRQPGTGRRNNTKRDGQGQYNWGADDDQSILDNPADFQKSKAIDTSKDKLDIRADSGDIAGKADKEKGDVDDKAKSNSEIADPETTENNISDNDDQSDTEKVEQEELDYDSFLKLQQENAVGDETNVRREIDGSEFDKERGGTYLFTRKDNSNDYFFVAEQKVKKIQRKTRKDKNAVRPELLGSASFPVDRSSGYAGRGRSGGGRGRSRDSRGFSRGRNRRGRARGGRGAVSGNWNDNSYDKLSNYSEVPEIADQQLFPSLS